MDHQNTLLQHIAGQAALVKYACPGCREAIYTTPPLNMLVICTLCEEILVGVDVP